MNHDRSKSTQMVMESYTPDDIIQWTNDIHECSNEKLLIILSEMEERWCIHEINNEGISFRLGFTNLFDSNNINPDSGLPSNIDIEEVATIKEREKEKLGLMYHRAKTLKVLDIDDDYEIKTSMRINRLIDQIEDAWQIIFRHNRIYERINKPHMIPINPKSDPSIFRSSAINSDAVEDMNPYQLALISILHRLYESNIRRYKGWCCKQIKTLEGYDTRAWKQEKEIKQYVADVNQKETDMELWKNLCSQGNVIGNVVKNLENCTDMQFPEIKRDRHVWSFKNGVLHGRVWSDQTGLYGTKFYDYTSNEFKNLDQSVVSCKYFDTEFIDYSDIEDWIDIPTPNFQSVLDYQSFEPDVAKWMYIMAGRLCFDLGDPDAWQVIPFLKGIARSGKSTLITKVFALFYEPDDARTLSNNCEKQFGLSAIYDGFMFISPEIRGDIRLEQAEFQSIVSGEQVSVAIKNKTATTMVWKVPGCLGGNEVPRWKDSSGSVLRRILTWDFSKQVKNADPTLDKKLERELPGILQKCIRGYLEYAQKYRDKDIWNIVPPYFKEIQSQVAQVTNTLENFLQSPEVIIEVGKKVPQKKFMEHYKDYCMANNLDKAQFNKDIYVGPFSQYDITVKNDSGIYNGQPFQNQRWIFGLDIVTEGIVFDESDV